MCEYYKITATANFDLGINGAGSLTFTQDGCDDKVQISGAIGIEKAEGVFAAGSNHGYHIHEWGIQSINGLPSCGGASTGGHFNPFDAPSGHFDNNRKNREVAQIGQLYCDAQCKFFSMKLKVLRSILDPSRSI